MKSQLDGFQDVSPRISSTPAECLQDGTVGSDGLSSKGVYERHLCDKFVGSDNFANERLDAAVEFFSE